MTTTATGLITAVNVVLPAPNEPPRILAYVSVELVGLWVVRGIKVLRLNGRLLVVMPGRKHTDLCPRCGQRCAVDAGYCWQCGATLDPWRAQAGPDGRARVHEDVAHPINREARAEVEEAVFAELRRVRPEVFAVQAAQASA